MVIYVVCTTVSMVLWFAHLQIADQAHEEFMIETQSTTHKVSLRAGVVIRQLPGVSSPNTPCRWTWSPLLRHNVVVETEKGTIRTGVLLKK